MSIFDKDVNFVHSLFGQANDSPKHKIDLVFFTIVAFFVFVIIWANFAKIDELARGEGKVIPTNKIQSIQSFDGGEIEEILVKNGEHVKIGQPLVKIDTTRFQASLEENQEGISQWMAMLERLKIESNIDIDKPIPEIEYTDDVKKIAGEYIESEKLLFKNRAQELKSSVQVLNSQLKQKEQELQEIKAKKVQIEKNLELLQLQRKTIKSLVEKGVKSKVDLISIEREYQQLKGDLESTELSIPRSQFAIKEAENKIFEKIRGFRTEASQEYQKILVELNKAQARRISDDDKVSKTVIKSPVDGIIKEIYVNTIGGVVKSGQDLIDIVPNSEVLLVEAKIDPRDIAFINPKQKAIVKITAYDYSIYGGLEGQIVEISADSIIDKDSKEGKSYYKVVVKTKRNYLLKDGEKLPIIPGMIAQVEIVTGEKSIMDFVLKPILKIKQNSLHER
ncbi:HlyD family type I secretion periplasmic adaptor subunit [Halarcobacter ebronensis]|uniref:HlyD family type I secretion periplasmic adaptor subunit n=1 Tax=Halarcobacter ebronensis TaxID=1462615 RepID=UPI001E5B7534|nr:HlyD family type I secretion periplasmic adaptor subunit [Halarcobacter ebronensis]QKF83218.1 type I secretion system membrane fusion protein, HlyD family [Halarcobacter ebronensis]